MKRILAILSVVLWAQLGLAAQVDCSARVVDTVGAFGPHLSEVESAAGRLADSGIEPRIVATSSSNLDLTERAMIQQCPEWQSQQNGIKSTLVILMVAPKEHKMGIYYGSAFKSALDQDWNRIKQEEMVPRFKDGDWAGGMVAAADHIAGRIKAQADEARHPQQTQVVEQAADLNGLWRFLGWALFVCSLAGLFIWLFYWLAQRAKHREEWAAARTTALMTRNRATIAVQKLRIMTLSKPQEDQFDSLYQRFTDLGNQSRFDPSDEGLQIGEYDAISKAYRDLAVDLEMLKWTAEGGKLETVSAAELKERVHGKKKSSIPDTPPPVTEGSGSGKGGTVGSSGTNIFAPVVGNNFGTEEKVEREPEPVHERERERGRDEDSGSGGSSSWDLGSSSSDSSSSSSDFGGGGSSDFGGGGGGFDSGSGGSSSF